VELAHAASEGETVWHAARRANDWNSFRPCLERIISLKKEEAGLLEIGEEAYDALLDDYEPGETTRGLESLFSELLQSLVDLLGRIEQSPGRPDSSILHRHFPRSEQESFARTVVGRLGYDFKAGRLDVSAHPFTVGVGPGDTRITTRYDEHFFGMAFFGTVHEAGHAMYDQGLLSEHWGTPMGEAVSLGIHESQSRMWENLICRSLPFWKYFYPQAQKHFPDLIDVPLDAFYFAVNNVSPSLIRPTR
jgi:carboxypeptidase Taq